jgi:hypothetical protein
MYPEGGFDVTCVIGSVRFGEGDMDPVEAAFKLIGQHRAEGRYQFPHEDGGEWIVEVGHYNPSTGVNGDGTDY